MGMVADSRGPRPCSLRAHCLYLPVAVILLTTINVAAQDRVILFDRPATGLSLPPQLREFEITDSGQRWSLLRTTTLPNHSPGTPVVLADGSRLLWLAYSRSLALAFLVQYEFATGGASIVNVGPFDLSAVLVADPYALRVMIVERERVVFVDQRLQPYSVALASLLVHSAAIAVADGYVVVQRTVASGVEAVVINSLTAEIVRTISLPGTGGIRATRDAQRLYRASDSIIEMRSLSTGQLLAQTTYAGGAEVFELDEARGLLIHTTRMADNQVRIGGRDLTSLAPLGELGFGLWRLRTRFQLTQTRHEGAILVFSTYIGTTGLEECEENLPWIDVFDGRSFAHAARIDLQRRCATVIAVPPR